MANTNTDNLIADKLLRMQLVSIRKQKHLTQKQLSKKSGLSESCISGIENDTDRSPTLRSLIRYANALDIQIYISENVD